LRVAMRYLKNLHMSDIAAYEDHLLTYANEKLSEIDGIRFYGKSSHKASLISFLIGEIHPYDAGTIIDKMGIAIRTGHHCAMPLMEYLRIPGTLRASFAFYNTTGEIDHFVTVVKKAKEMLA
jgi:cysteine desulfurase / selenocysteine lyase